MPHGCAADQCLQPPCSALTGVGVVDKPQLLYNMMHSYLQQAGVDGVKVDCQAGVGLAGGAGCCRAGPGILLAYPSLARTLVWRLHNRVLLYWTAALPGWPGRTAHGCGCTRG